MPRARVPLVSRPLARRVHVYPALGHAQELVPGAGRLLNLETVGQQRVIDERPRLCKADDCRLAFLDRSWRRRRRQWSEC